MTHMLPAYRSVCTLIDRKPSTSDIGRGRGLVVERRAPEREVRGSIITQVKSTGNTQEAVAPSRHD